VKRADDFSLTVMGLHDGDYVVQWWETWKGTPGVLDTVPAKDGKLRLEFTGLKTDATIRISNINRSIRAMVHRSFPSNRIDKESKKNE
jgi:hypothetical protein